MESTGSLVGDERIVSTLIQIEVSVSGDTGHRIRSPDLAGHVLPVSNGHLSLMGHVSKHGPQFTPLYETLPSNAAPSIFHLHHPHPAHKEYKT